MSVYQELEDIDKIFNNLKRPPIFINYLSSDTEEDSEKLKNLISVTYEGDLMKNVASCECGKISGDFNLGIFCNECNTEVKSATDVNLDFLLWFKSPIGVERLIKPNILCMLSENFTISGFNIIQYLIDYNYKPNVKTPPIIENIDKLNLPRGYNNFVRNFDFIIETLFNMKKFPKKQEHYELYKLLINNRNNLFHDQLPLPNKSMLVIEKTNSASYVDPSTLGAIDAIQIISGVDCENKKYSTRVKENRTVKALFGMMEYYYNFYKESLGKKPGIFRQHVFGGRSFFSFRTVITSISEPHRIDEIHIPWSVAISIFRYHICNKLFKRNYLLDDILSLLNNYAKKYHPLLEQIFKELIEESPDKGIYVTINRNPSLVRGSIQRVRITKIKLPGSPTTSISNLIVVPLNAD